VINKLLLISSVSDARYVSFPLIVKRRQSDIG
jgi:hypothetical protein